MPKPIPFSPRKPCRTCGRPVVLAYRNYIAVVASATGERRYHHRRCVRFFGRRGPDLAA